MRAAAVATARKQEERVNSVARDHGSGGDHSTSAAAAAAVAAARVFPI